MRKNNGGEQAGARGADVDSSGNGMCDALSSHCSRFSRRSDVNVFNMGDYRSCENCRHNTHDNQCLAKMDTSVGTFN